MTLLPGSTIGKEDRGATSCDRCSAARFLRDFEPDRWSGRDCAEIAEELARAAKACAVGVGKGRGASVACNAGDVEWVARTSGAHRAQRGRAVDADRGGSLSGDQPTRWRGCGLAGRRRRRSWPRRRRRRVGGGVAGGRGETGWQDCGRRRGGWCWGRSTATSCIAEQHAARSVTHWVDERGWWRVGSACRRRWVCRS